MDVSDLDSILLTVMAISDGNGGRKRSVLKSDKTSSCGDAVFTCKEKVSLEDQQREANSKHQTEREHQLQS